MLTIDAAREIADGWSGEVLSHFARTGDIACRARMLAEIRTTRLLCARTAANYGPDMIDSPEAMDETAFFYSNEAVRQLTALAEWTTRQDGCSEASGCACSSLGPSSGQLR